MKSWTRLALAGLVAAGVPAMMVWIAVRACGPNFEPEVFVPTNRPANSALFAKGRLGVLQRSYYHEDLVVAYRYLHGGKLSAAEEAVYNPPAQPPADAKNWQEGQNAIEAAKPNNRWVAARMAYDVDGVKGIGDIPEERVVDRKQGSYSFWDNQLNCTDGAFENAIVTLAARAKAWGAQSAELREWLRGQDAVFSNCGKPGSLPNAIKPEWPVLLRQDRAYQLAAAAFYAGNFDDAISGFEAVGRDASSPWNRWGEYLAARAEVRKAAATAVDPAAFDPLLLRAAQERLSCLEQGTRDPRIRHAVEDELGFIQVRLDPSARLDAVSAALAGPAPDPEFRNHVTDLDWLIGRDDVKPTAELARWIQAMRSGSGKEAVGRSGLPWLVASLDAVQKDDPRSPSLLEAAAKVPANSPAYVTVNYHRARLLLAEGKTAEARALTTTVLAGLGKDENATRNTLLEERLPTAQTVDEFLADAPRTLIESGSGASLLALCGSWGKPRSGCVKTLPPTEFDGDGAAAFNRQLPLALWLTAAQEKTLPANLRQSVAWAAWLRALGLGDQAMVKQLAPLLPVSVREAAGDSDGFPATMALLRNPGLRPYLQQGVQRSLSFGAMDELRDNYWCGKWGDGEQINEENSAGAPSAPAVERLPFLTAEQAEAAASERMRLNELPQGTVWLGQRTIAYVRSHPDDKEAAEALALTVRATHYGCDTWEPDSERRTVSKEAFEMLHRLYPKSEWAEKTKYYY